MMDKQEFIDGLEMNFVNLLPAEYTGAQMTFRDVNSSRGTYFGADVRVPGEISTMMPILNIDALYEKVKDMDVTSAVNYAASVYGEFLENNDLVKKDPNIMDKVHSLSEYENVKDLLYVTVCAEAGHKVLNDAPHQMKEDIPLIARIMMVQDGEYSASVMVTDAMMNVWGIDEETLFNDAFENTMKMLPSNLQSMYTVLSGLIDDPEFYEDMGPGMYVYSNEQKSGGAAGIFAPGEMDRMSEQLGGSYYIIPSSVHELILVPEKAFESPSEAMTLVDMVRDVNATQVSADERITDNAYHYDADKKSFEQVKDYVDRLEKEEELSAEKEQELSNDTPKQEVAVGM